MRGLFVLALFCAIGSAIAQEKFACVEPNNNNVITLRFMRHGWSCAQCCRDIVLKLKLTNPKFLHPCLESLATNKDPRLTDIGIKLLVEKAKNPQFAKCLPLTPDWTLMTSTMTRTIQTALALFPKSKILAVPYMKECIVVPLTGICAEKPFNLDFMPEDKLSATPAVQAQKLGAVVNEVTFFNETLDKTDYSVIKGGKWTDLATTTDPKLFLKFLAAYAKAHNKRKFMLVTHNGVMMKLMTLFSKSKFALPRPVENAEIWEGQIDLNGNAITSVPLKQVYKPVGTGGKCSDFKPAQFNDATKTCGWKAVNY